MFTRPDVVTLTTWRAGHLIGLDVRWIDGAAPCQAIAEIYPQRHPEQPRWHLSKPARDRVCLRHLPTGEVTQQPSVEVALAAVLHRELAERKALSPGADQTC